MTNAAGLTYDGPEGCSGIIESIVHIQIRKVPPRDGDPEDLKQEMRMAAIKAMAKYDPTRIGPSPYKFLEQCVRNHVYNLNRGVYVPNNPPCVRCELWDKVNKTCRINEEGCEAIVRYRQNMETKKSLRSPDRLPDFDLSTPRGAEDIDAFVLDESIKSRLPADLLEDYVKLTSGQKVDPRRKTKIRRIVKKLLEEDD